jgi:hypothetical protein
MTNVAVHAFYRFMGIFRAHCLLQLRMAIQTDCISIVWQQCILITGVRLMATIAGPLPEGLMSKSFLSLHTLFMMALVTQFWTCCCHQDREIPTMRLMATGAVTGNERAVLASLCCLLNHIFVATETEFFLGPCQQ